MVHALEGKKYTAEYEINERSRSVVCETGWRCCMKESVFGINFRIYYEKRRPLNLVIQLWSGEDDSGSEFIKMRPMEYELEMLHLSVRSVGVRAHEHNGLFLIGIDCRFSEYVTHTLRFYWCPDSQTIKPVSRPFPCIPLQKTPVHTISEKQDRSALLKTIEA